MVGCVKDSFGMTALSSHFTKLLLGFILPVSGLAEEIDSNFVCPGEVVVLPPSVGHFFFLLHP